MSNINKASYTWTLRGFRKLINQYNIDECVASPVFPEYENHCQWQIECFPSGHKCQSSHVALYLKGILRTDDIRAVTAKISLKIRDSNDKLIWSRCFEDIFTEEHSSLGFSSTMQRELLLSKIPDDTLKIRTVVWIELITFTSTYDVLRWDAELNTASHLSNDLSVVFVDKKFADFALKVEDNEIPVHRTVLAARSPVFSAMFDVATKDYAEIKELDKETTELLLKFIYTGKYDEITIEMTEKLLAAANTYAVADLKFLCEDILSENLAVSNALHTLIFAYEHEAKTLKQNTMDYIVRNIWKFFNATFFKSVAETSPILLSEIMLNVTELQVKNQKNEYGKKLMVEPPNSTKPEETVYELK